MSSHLTIGDRWRVISLRLDQGINCSVQTVCNILQLFNDANDVIEREERGGGNSLTNDEVYTLSQLLYRYLDETSIQLNNRLYLRTGRLVTPRTIRNYRGRLKFHSVHARIQPLMNQRHADERLAFCEQYMHDDWRRVIFDDEKIFEVDASGIVYWIPYRRPTTFRSQVQYRIAMFGAVWYNIRSNLVFIQGLANTSTFVEYLDFVHDRPMWVHTATAHSWLFRNHIICMDDYPPVNPDLNAIEYVWSWMNQFVQRRRPNSQ
jgi:hypothetical protein